MSQELPKTVQGISSNAELGEAAIQAHQKLRKQQHRQSIEVTETGKVHIDLARERPLALRATRFASRLHVLRGDSLMFT